MQYSVFLALCLSLTEPVLNRSCGSVLQCVVMCCRLLQCVAGCSWRSVPLARQVLLQRVAVCCSVLQRVAVCCSVLQCVAACCSVLQCCSVSQGVALCRSVLQCVIGAPSTILSRLCCSVVQRVAV